MRDFKYAELCDSSVYLPLGRPGERPLLLPLGVTVDCDWLDDGQAWVNPLLLAYRDHGAVTIKLMVTGGRAFKTLRFEPAVGGGLKQIGDWPQSFQQWRDDNQRWPIGDASASVSEMPALPPGYPVAVDPCVRGYEL